MQKKPKKNNFNALSAAVDFLIEEEKTAKSKVELLHHHVKELTGVDPNQPLRAMDVLKIICPLIEKEFKRLIAEHNSAN